jgi:hypothetical protein
MNVRFQVVFCPKCRSLHFCIERLIYINIYVLGLAMRVKSLALVLALLLPALALVLLALLTSLHSCLTCNRLDCLRCTYKHTSENITLFSVA